MSTDTLETEKEAESDTEDEEEEPKLKYERLYGDARNILKKDGACCFSANSKLLIVGTSWGRIHVLDHQGNKIQEYAPHCTPISCLDMDAHGDYIASCSSDRKVVIQGLYTTENSHCLVMDFVVKCVALDPFYYSPKSNRRFVVGEQNLVLYEKSYFGQLRSTLLSEGMGLIRAIKWGDQFLAWATDSGVRLMDMTTKSFISLIKRNHSMNLGCEQYPPYLHWKDHDILLVGWGDTFKFCRVRERSITSSYSGDKSDLPQYCAEIIHMFTTDFFVCGIAPLDKHVVILAYSRPSEITEDGNLEWKRPQVLIVELMQGKYEVLSRDVLGIKGYQQYMPVNYKLAYLKEDERYYIICPQDIVVAKLRDDCDHIQWLLEHKKFEEALKLVKSSQTVKQYSILSVGQLYMEHLLKEKKFNEAAKLSPQIYGTSKKLWENAIMEFNRLHQLRVLSPHLPLGSPGPKLDPEVYQTVLFELLHFDQQGLLSVVQEWPSDLYNISSLINAVLENLAKNPNNLLLLQVLAHLYSNIEKHDKALAIYLKLQHKDVFSLITKHSLYGCIAKHIIDLMSLDKETTLNLCFQYSHILTPDSVVAVLQNNENFLYLYLDGLYERCRNLSVKFHSWLVVLYADRAREKLLPLLTSSSSYDLKKALKVCQARGLMPETVHLLERTGNCREALRLLLMEECYISRAIALCKDHQDFELWDILIEFSLTMPVYVKELLNNVGTHIDPLLIIKKIPKGLEIPDLRDALVKILQDYQLQISLRTGCQNIMIYDCFNLLKKQIHIQSAGLPVNVEEELESVVVFGCRHIFHNTCIPSITGQDVCIVCKKDSKKIR